MTITILNKTLPPDPASSGIDTVEDNRYAGLVLGEFWVLCGSMPGNGFVGFDYEMEKESTMFGSRVLPYSMTQDNWGQRQCRLKNVHKVFEDVAALQMGTSDGATYLASKWFHDGWMEFCEVYQIQHIPDGTIEKMKNKASTQTASMQMAQMMQQAKMIGEAQKPGLVGPRRK